jgi:hypothetical protein
VTVFFLRTRALAVRLAGEAGVELSNSNAALEREREVVQEECFDLKMQLEMAGKAGLELLNSKTALEHELDVVREQCFDLQKRFESAERRVGILHEQRQATVEENLSLTEKYETVLERQQEVVRDLANAQQDVLHLQEALHQEKSASRHWKQLLESWKSQKSISAPSSSPDERFVVESPQASLSSKKSVAATSSTERFVESPPHCEAAERQPASTNEEGSITYPDELDDIL